MKNSKVRIKSNENEIIKQKIKNKIEISRIMKIAWKIPPFHPVAFFKKKLIM